MTDISLEGDAVDWLHEHFEATDGLTHLRARKRGRVVTIESGPAGDAVSHARFRRDTVHLWLLEMPGRGHRWEPTPYRDNVASLMALLEETFPWALAAIDENPDTTSDPGY